MDKEVQEVVDALNNSIKKISELKTKKTLTPLENISLHSAEEHVKLSIQKVFEEMKIVGAQDFIKMSPINIDNAELIRALSNLKINFTTTSDQVEATYNGFVDFKKDVRFAFSVNEYWVSCRVVIENFRINPDKKSELESLVAKYNREKRMFKAYLDESDTLILDRHDLKNQFWNYDDLLQLLRYEIAIGIDFFNKNGKLLNELSFDNPIEN